MRRRKRRVTRILGNQAEHEVLYSELEVVMSLADNAA